MKLLLRTTTWWQSAIKSLLNQPTWDYIIRGTIFVADEMTFGRCHTKYVMLQYLSPISNFSTNHWHLELSSNIQQYLSWSICHPFDGWQTSSIPWLWWYQPSVLWHFYCPSRHCAGCLPWLGIQCFVFQWKCSCFFSQICWETLSHLV